jgi:hypothetical protein
VPNPHFAQDELAATVKLHEASVLAHAARRGQEIVGQIGKKGRRLSKALPIGVRLSQQGRTSDSLSIGSGSGVGGGGWDGAVYAADLEKRIRGLDWKVQDEIYELLSDRVQSTSNAFRRRDWRVVVMAAIPGGELTYAPTGFGQGPSGAQGKGSWLNGLKRWKDLPGCKTKWDAKMPVTEYRLILRGVETKANDQGWGYYNRYSRPWRLADEKEIGEKRRWSTMSGRSEKYVDF